MGFVKEDAFGALEFLLEHGLIQADHMRRKGLGSEDFVRAHAAGFVHLRLLTSRMEYVAAIVPATFIVNGKLAARLGQLSQINAGHSDIQFRRKQEITHAFLEYLKDE